MEPDGSLPCLQETASSVQWIPGALYLGVKRPGREADHSPPSNTEVKECVELYIHSPNTPSWRGAQLKKRTGTTLPLPLFQSWNSALRIKEIQFLSAGRFKLRNYSLDFCEISVLGGTLQ
jgi:hypothetical protein